MARTWDERLARLSQRLAEMSRQAAEASEDAKCAREMRREALQDKISTARGNVAAMQENARLAEEERESKLRSAMLKARMTAKARQEDHREARDRKRMERDINDTLDYILECYESADFLMADAGLSIYELAEVAQEYERRFGGDDATPAQTADDMEG